jgi:hypothetical protein
MRARLVRRHRRRLTHYWDQHPLHQLRAHALRAGVAAALALSLVGLVIRVAPSVVLAGLVLLVAAVVAWEAFGHLRAAQLETERDERRAVRLKPALALRRRRVQRLLDEYVAPEIQAELVHEIGVFNGLEDELDRLDAGTAVELDGMLIRPARRAKAE